MRSWKTTVLGICGVLMALCKALEGIINGTPVDYQSVAGEVTLGVGLIFAKDHNVTGGTNAQNPTNPS